MENQNQQAVERIKQANNILVTVSNNPSVDQLAACIGVTLALNKMGKHATAVFSGVVPSTIEFLRPERTIETNTDSLRDFIIALDKSKADKLRYKVEDRVVKIFITPYRNSISEKDLEFSQGDFNVEVVLALGVHNQADIDQAITSHGRILHDATVITMNVQPGGELGGIDWLDTTTSSLSELTTQLLNMLDKKLVDAQIATALLTGIVAATDRFSNTQTYPQTMSVSAELMAAGADQQLVAAKLNTAASVGADAISQGDGDTKFSSASATQNSADDTLDIPHDNRSDTESNQAAQHSDDAASSSNGAQLPPYFDESDAHAPFTPQIDIDEQGALSSADESLPPVTSEIPTIGHHAEPPKIMLETPTTGSPPANAADPDLTGPPMSRTVEPAPATGEEAPSGGAVSSESFIVGGLTPEVPPTPPETPKDHHSPAPGETLSEIEEDMHSSHLNQNSQSQSDAATSPDLPQSQGGNTASAAAPPSLTPENIPAETHRQEGEESPQQQDQAPQSSDLTDARDAVTQAINESASSEPFDNSQTVQLTHGDIHTSQTAASAPSTAPVEPVQPWTVSAPTTAARPTLDIAEPVPAQQQSGSQNGPDAAGQNYDPNAPPPVPPPMMPPTSQY